MKNKPFLQVLPVLALVPLLLVVGCAEDSSLDDPDLADNILRVDKVEPSIIQSSLSSGTDDVVAATISGTSRGMAGGSTLNDVILDTYTVVFNPPLPDAGGPIASLTYGITAIVPIDGTLSLSGVVIVPGTIKATLIAAAGSQFAVTLVFSGEDLNGDPASAESQLTVVTAI